MFVNPEFLPAETIVATTNVCSLYDFCRYLYKHDRHGIQPSCIYRYKLGQESFKNVIFSAKLCILVSF